MKTGPLAALAIAVFAAFLISNQTAKLVQFEVYV
jgi:hypothetical protein